MDFQSPGIYVLLGAVLSSATSLITTFFNNNIYLERERKQRIWQAETDREKWYREKIYDSYMKSIQILTKIIQEKFKTKLINEYNPLYSEDHDVDLVLTLKNLHFEFTSEFSIIFVGHPYKDTKEFNDLINEILSDSMDEDPFLARVVITRMMEDDPRIKDVNKGYLNSENTPIS